MKKRIVSKIFAALMIISLSGCYYDSVLPQEPQGVVSFSQNVQPIFNAKCTTCHNANHTLNLSPDVSYSELISESYINTADPANSPLYQKLNGGSMSSYASPSDKATILKWIEQGAKNN